MQNLAALFLVLFVTIINAQDFVLGVEAIEPAFLEQQQIKKDARIGIVANQTSKTLSKQSSVESLIAKGFNITHIFVPEHGYDGKVLAEKEVKDAVDPRTNIPIVSLYRTDGPKEVDLQLLEKIDCILFDLQDVGMRHYTYISTLYKIMEVAAKTQKPLIVLDRPNPLGPLMEGPLVQKNLISFISIAPIPLKHGMTIGEIALYFNTFLMHKKVKLSVVVMKNYQRDKPELFTMLAPLSPNIQTRHAIWGYSFLGLLGTISPFDVGVGTENAFSLIALPEKMLSRAGWKKIGGTLSEYGIKIKPFKSHKKEKKKQYEGLLLTITDPTKIRTNDLLEAILKLCVDEKIKLNFILPSSDKAFGSPLFRKSVFAKKKYLVNEKALDGFYQKAQTIFLYKPWPTFAQ
jgi:uncharacterized protein YbbC (DUF1343 family)